MEIGNKMHEELLLLAMYIAEFCAVLLVGGIVASIYEIIRGGGK